MFGIANQMLAVIALAVVTTWLINNGRRRYAPLTICPMLFVIASTVTAGVQLSSGAFGPSLLAAMQTHDYANVTKWGLNLVFTVFIIGAVLLIVSEAAVRWMKVRAEDGRPRTN